MYACLYSAMIIWLIVLTLLYMCLQSKRHR